MPEQRKLNKRKGADWWGTKYPSAFDAVLAFAQCIRSELKRCAAHDLPTTEFFDRPPPRMGHFTGLVMSEFLTLAKKLAPFPNAERDAMIVHLRDVRHMSFGKIALRLRTLNRAWVGKRQAS
jgi:hypothetical protein